MSNKAIELLYLAKQSKIDIVLSDGQLQLKLPKNTSIDKNLLQDLKDSKEVIVDFLKNNLRNTSNQNKIARFDRNSVSKIPLSYSQERLWFIDRLEGSVQYHMTPILRLKGELNGKAVEHALKTIIDRHEILRTVFCEDQGHGYQVIKEKGNWMLSEVDGSAFKENYAALQQYLDVLIKQPFDLSKDYMLRAHLIRIDDNDHVLAVIIHHIASDGWSISVLVKEVVELYNSFNENRPAALPVLDVQYADYSIWQRGFLGGELFDRKIGYWKNKLEGVEILQLPTDYARPAVQSTRGATIRSVIKKEVSIQLQAFSKQQGGTFFMALLAAFKVLLSRYSGQQDICVGTPIAGRQQQELEGLIGFFVNTLAIRTEVNGEDTFTDFFQQVRKVTMEAFENQEMPFEKIVDEVVKERSLSRSPLFQVMMVYMNTPEVPEMRLGEIKLSKENLERTTAKFDIQVFLTDTPEGLSMIIEYCTDLFCDASMNRMMGHFKELLLSIITDPLQKIGDLSMLPKAEEQQLLVELNNTARDYPKDKTVISFFEQQVTKTPDAVAVIFEEEQFTYAELNRLANQLAHYLRSKSVKEETLVPLCVERSPQMIVGIWGILKAGAAYVPIDPEYPEDRISYMLEDTNATLIITSKDCLDKISATGNIEAIILDKSFSLISNEPVVNMDIPVSNNHLAYVIYTSGSTGKPKGAMNEHGALSNRLFWAQDYFNLTHQDAVLQKTTFCFDVSVWELIWPLLVGARLVFAKPGGQKDNIYIKSVIEKNKITVLHFVPSMLNVFLPDLRSGDCMSLNKVLCSGESLKNSHVELFKKKLPKVELHNLYGPTEAAID
ncbi:MAG: AMP-binding protein, partial [Bacteroidetes bacterium]|nr:AMP-binding protein [Bacteroidota bacterium]